jgi:hypothetical protein
MRKGRCGVGMAQRLVNFEMDVSERLSPKLSTQYIH